MPIVLNKDSVISACRHTILQELKGKSSKRSFADIKSNICRLLEIRLKQDSIPKWVEFFDSVPYDEANFHSSYINTLAILSSEFGCELQPAKQFLTSRLPTANDFIDSMIFKGGVVTRLERIAVLQTLNQYKPNRHIPVVQGKLINNL